MYSTTYIWAAMCTSGYNHNVLYNVYLGSHVYERTQLQCTLQRISGQPCVRADTITMDSTTYIWTAMCTSGHNHNGLYNVYLDSHVYERTQSQWTLQRISGQPCVRADTITMDSTTYIWTAMCTSGHNHNGLYNVYLGSHVYERTQSQWTLQRISGQPCVRADTITMDSTTYIWAAMCTSGHNHVRGSPTTQS